MPERVLASDRMVRIKRIARAPDEATRLAETFAVFGIAEAAAMARGSAGQGDDLVDPVRRWMPSTPANDDSLNRLLLVDTRLSLADDLLIVADNMSMASSVELRVPFLDLELLGLIEAMPSRYKVSLFGGRKWLYRRSVSRILQPSLRPSLVGLRARFGRKLGFTTPFDDWFRHWSETDAEEYLLGKQARIPEYLRTEPVRGLLTAVREKARPRSRQLLSLYVLETWLRGALGDDGCRSQGRA
jgi:asparagine synthase (glutamine-hydrolysing)